MYSIGDSNTASTSHLGYSVLLGTIRLPSQIHPHGLPDLVQDAVKEPFIDNWVRSKGFLSSRFPSRLSTRNQHYPDKAG